jgi:hypothetical protein
MPFIQRDDEIVEVPEDYFNIPASVNESQVRLQRDALLAETDWWAVGDRTMTQAERDYRQALRDVPAQDGFPLDINWPTKPE